MKKIIALVLALIMTFSLAVPVFAAASLSSNESTLYDEFCSVVDKWCGFNEKSRQRGIQFKSKGRNALLVANLSKSACEDLSNCIKEVDAFIASKHPQSAHDMFLLAFDVVPIVNATGNKYGFKVSLDMEEYSEVLYKEASSGQYRPVDDILSGMINQTGFDFSGTILMAVLLSAAVGSCLVFAKKELVFA